MSKEKKFEENADSYISKLEKSSVLFDDKREQYFLEDDSSDNLAKHAKPSSFDAKDIASFQENIKELEYLENNPLDELFKMRKK